MIVYRIAQAKYIKDFSGYGAYLAGGRWTLQGVYALYTAVHQSLAYLEYLVHQIDRDTWPVNVKIASINIGEYEDIVTPKIASLPEKWNQLSYHVEVQLVGTKLFKERVLGIKVPSAIVPGEQNLILNPSHSDFLRIVKIAEVDSLNLDQRFSR